MQWQLAEGRHPAVSLFQKIHRHKLAMWAVAGAAGVSAIMAGWKGIASAAARILPYDAGVKEGLFAATPSIVIRVARWDLLLTALLACAVLTALALRSKLKERRVRNNLILLGSTIACSLNVFLLFYRASYESEWYPINQIVTRPETMGIFGRRLLFIWPAQLLHHLAPWLSARSAFLIVQGCVILLAVAAIGQWSQAFAGELAYWGQILFVAMIATTFQYFNAYDIGIVFFYTLAFLLLLKRKFALFVITVGAGTLNHENTLLLAPMAAVACVGRERLRTVLALVFWSLAAWLAVRSSIAFFMPANGGYDLRFFTNLWIFYHPDRALIESIPAYMLWAVLFAAGFRYADPFLKRLALLWIPLTGVTYLFGKFSEFRQFDAFVPIVVATTLSQIRHMRESRESDASADGRALPQTRVSGQAAGIAELSCPKLS